MHGKVRKMVNFMVYIFYHNKKTWGKKTLLLYNSIIFIDNIVNVFQNNKFFPTT